MARKLAGRPLLGWVALTFILAPAPRAYAASPAESVAMPDFSISGVDETEAESLNNALLGVAATAVSATNVR